jgi:hypothetical protein
MVEPLRAGYFQEYEDRSFEGPFMERDAAEAQYEPVRRSLAGETIGEAWEAWELHTPFVGDGATELGETTTPSAEAAALAEITTELKDSSFREALEQLADEALDMHAEQLAGEYGDREERDLAATRLLNEHFQPLAVQTEAMLDRFFERLEGYEAEALTDMEIERIAAEVLPLGQPISPASEQFLGGLLRKVGKVVSSVATAPLKLAAKGLAFAGKLALKPLLAPLRKLARFLLGHVVRFALNRMPVELRPLARQLSDRLFHEIADAHESEAQEYEQNEVANIPAAPDVARLEAEFDLHAAQLLLTPDEAEADHLVSAYGNEAGLGYESPISALDRARSDLAAGLSRLQPGESAQPVMEQFLPAIAALWPALKGTVAIIGHDRVKKFIGGLLANLIKPILGAQPASMLAPAIADAGLHLFGFESGSGDPRVVANEALTATIEDTATRLGELPPHVFANETLLEDAVREAFEDAAASYFPGSLIKPELRETPEEKGAWVRLPRGTDRKRYAKYSQSLPVEITPRVAESINSFGGSTLKDHLRDRMDVPSGRTLKTHVRLYQAMPGTRAATIARSEGIRPHDLHPLTPHAAAALLGRNAGLGPRHHTPAPYLSGPHKLHVHQRLYYVEPPNGRQHVHQRHHARLARTELLINLRKGEIHIWLYLSERLCQQIATEFNKTHGAGNTFRLIKPLVHRAARMLKEVVLERHLPAELRVVSETPNLEAKVPNWLVQIGHQLATKVEEWASQQVAQYLKNNADEFRRVSAAHHDGVTLSIKMSRVPGMETLRLASQRRKLPAPEGTGWLNGTPAFAVVAHPGYALR